MNYSCFALSYSKLFWTLICNLSNVCVLTAKLCVYVCIRDYPFLKALFCTIARFAMIVCLVFVYFLPSIHLCSNRKRDTVVIILYVCRSVCPPLLTFKPNG